MATGVIKMISPIKCWLVKKKQHRTSITYSINLMDEWATSYTQYISWIVNQC